MERLKQKVASSSSRVIASLQQAASGAAPSSVNHRAAPEVPAPSSTSNQQASVPSASCLAPAASTSYQATAISSPFVGGLSTAEANNLVAEQILLASAKTINSNNDNVADVDNVAPVSTASKLMGTNATAHLTEEEREILLQVFKKEEQFQRDTIK